MQAKLDGTCERLGWPVNEETRLRAISHVWRSYVIPILLEYFHANWLRARIVAGFARTQKDSYELFNSIKADDWLLEELGREEDLSDAESFEIATWWDPNGRLWDADRFRGFLSALATSDRVD